MKALILVDIQNDFLPGGSLAVPDGNAIIPVVNRLQEQFELVVATQDWHPPGHKSFASNHPGKKVYDVIDLNGSSQVLWPDHCVQGTTGANFPPGLQTYRVEAILRKGTNPEIDTYSAFYDNDRRKSTGLAGYLHEKNVHDVYITGLASDICVYFTAMDSLQEKFTTWFIEDAARPLVQEDYMKYMHEFVTHGGKVIRSNEVGAER